MQCIYKRNNAIDVWAEVKSFYNLKEGYDYAIAITYKKALK